MLCMDVCGRIKKCESQHAHATPDGLRRYKSCENMRDESKRMRDESFFGKNERAVRARKIIFFPNICFGVGLYFLLELL
jgi:hypothetical protein